MKKKYFFYGFILSFLCFFYASVLAAVVSPVEMLQTTADKMIAQLNIHKSTLKSDPNKVYTIVQRVLMPHVDMKTLSKSVIGRQAWMVASLNEQNLFIQQFTQLLIRTYASALAAYSNQKVIFFPLREKNLENVSDIEVKSQIIQPEGPPIPLTYRLLLENNAWKVIDFSVDNVSVSQNFRAQFAGDLNQGGLTYLNKKLSTRHASPQI